MEIFSPHQDAKSRFSQARTPVQAAAAANIYKQIPLSTIAATQNDGNAGWGNSFDIAIAQQAIVFWSKNGGFGCGVRQWFLKQ